jgi:hypothetical protein
MTVYVVTEETNGFNGGEPDNVVIGVFATEAAAEGEVRTRTEAARAIGKDVWGDEGDGNDDWDVDFHIEAHEVQGVGAPA